MPEVICDTSFLMHMAAGRIHNIDGIQMDMGNLDYAVPDAVTAELERLLRNPAKRPGAEAALRLAGGMRAIRLGDAYADAAIVRHVRGRGGLVATMDRGLKKAVRNAGGRTISVHGDRIVFD